LVLGRPILAAFVFLAGVDALLSSSVFIVSSPALNNLSTLEGLRAGVDSFEPSDASVCFLDFFTGLAAFFCSSSSALRFNCNCSLSSSSVILRKCLISQCHFFFN
jgi:hypothetical protein